MKDYPCWVCKGAMNVGMCQSGVRHDGETKAAHVGCADLWSNEEIHVWKVASPGNGSYCEEFPENVTEMLKEMSHGEEYVITRMVMKRAKYESLPEFQGF
jgi:hypothetical protein